MPRTARRVPRRSALAVLALIVAGCSGSASSADLSTIVTTGSPPSGSVDTSTTSTTSPPTTTTSSPSTTVPAPVTTTSTTTTTPTTTAPSPMPTLPATHEAFDRLAGGNPAATMTVRRDGRTILQRASGTTIDGALATSDSPMVVASVGKLVTALLVARLDQGGILDIDAATPWSATGLVPHPGWADVTPRELLAHSSGMPVVRPQWFEGTGDCRSFLPSLLVEPPRSHRGTWTYSNGNYCALGLLVEAFTSMPLDRAAQVFLFEPLGATGIHLTSDGQLPTDVAYALGVHRLNRLGGAGSFIVSTDDLAALIESITTADRETLAWPGVFVDQYGWGHTGSVDGAVSCAWTLDDGRTVVVATAAGKSPDTGGGLCDRIIPAVARDLDLPVGGDPDRSPP